MNFSHSIRPAKDIRATVRGKSETKHELYRTKFRKRRERKKKKKITHPPEAISIYIY